MFRAVFRVSALLALCGAPRAGLICNLVFEKCPGEWAGGSLSVPANVVWLDAKIPVCPEDIRVQSAGAAPSIVFVIDNSSSMSKGDVDNSSGGNDPEEARFRVVRDMLDTIARNSPAAEVGLVIYTRRLQFDDRDNPFFRRAFADTAQHDAYVPLTRLDRDLGGGITGLDTLKALLKYTGNGNLAYATRFPDARANSRYTPDNLRDGTDITLGFEAAKTAMADARAAKADRYVIFLSDGEPQNVDTTRVGGIDDFQSGRDVPTTFTVFFKGGSDSPKAPKTIQAMTDSIRANGYSESNPKSAYWAINQPGVQLDTLLRNRVLNPIFTQTAGKAEKAVLAVAGNRYNSAATDGKSFDFAKRVALTGETTTVELVYTYAFVDSGRAKTRDVPYTLTVRRNGAAASMPAGLSSSCQEQGDLALYAKGVALARVTADHRDLEVRLALGAGETCDGCKVEIRPSQGADRENVAMSASGGYRTGNFSREIGSPAPGNGRLEHAAGDSIIAIYVNPENPLDVIRKAFPYTDAVTSLSLIGHNEYARAGEGAAGDAGRQFVLVAPPDLPANALIPIAGAGRNWGIIPSLATADSGRYVGSVIEASRPFRVEVSIFSNLGQFVNRLGFEIPAPEFAKLPGGTKAGTRRLRVLWNNRAEDGRPAGTGAYIMKTAVTLSPVSGAAGDKAESAQLRRIGVLRER